MKCYIGSEVRMHLDTSGRVRAKHPSAAYDAWKPFLDSFGQIEILARLDLNSTSDSGVLVEGKGVSVIRLPYYTGALSLPLGVLRVRKALKSVGSSSDVFIGRVPEIISLLLLGHARNIGAMTMSMLVADPRKTIQNLLPFPLGKLLDLIFTSLTRQAIMASDAVSYVSENYFQREFPAPNGIPTIGRSNVAIPRDWVANYPKNSFLKEKIKLITVGTLEHSSKGMDFLIDVVSELQSQGMLVELTIVGEGRQRRRLEERARSRQANVIFTGQVEQKEKLKSLLDASDIYVSGSRAEGLPRSSIEAMARGLPLVTTNAGAAGELAETPFLVAIEDKFSFSAAIQLLARNHDLYIYQSNRSLATAKRIRDAADPKLFSGFLSKNLLNLDREHF